MAEKTSKNQTAQSPEGPYENESSYIRGSLQKQDLNRFLDFVVALYDESERIFGFQIAQRDMRLVIELVRNHFTGVLVTKGFGARIIYWRWCSRAANEITGCLNAVQTQCLPPPSLRQDEVPGSELAGI